MTPILYDKVTRDIKDYVFHYHIQSPKAWHRARIAFLDALGCAVETVSESAECRRLFGPFVPGSTTPDGFSLPGTSYELDPVKGAFDMGTAIRFLDHNDAIAGADWGHPSDNIGAILAVTDWLSRSSASGRITHKGPPLTIDTLLTAIIKAYEIQGCFLLQNAFHAHGLDHVILVKLASTAIVSWLLGCSEKQTEAAISHVWMDGHPLRVYRSGTNTIPRKGWAAGDACMRAVHLALLAKAGQLGSPTALTMPRWGFYATMWDGKEFQLPKAMGSWVIENVFFKSMPVEGHGISAVEAALVHSQTLRARGLDPVRHIARVAIRTNAAANLIINKTGTLTNAADRDHCMQYVVALALLKGGAPEVKDFQDGSPWASSESLSSLRERIEISEDGGMTRDYLDWEKKSLASGVTVVLTDGTCLDEVVVEFPVGHVNSEKTEEQVREKLIRNLGLMFSRAEIVRAVEMLEEGERSIHSFGDLFARERDTGAKL
ncbi:hypothetical protein ACLMJK_007565 [Lecanora helva]